MITYGSYFNDKTPPVKTAVQVSVLDSLVANSRRCGHLSRGIRVDNQSRHHCRRTGSRGSGITLYHITRLFNQMAGSMIWSTLFFCLLALAALTSTISLMEVVTVYIHEEYHISRRKSTLLVTAGVIILGIFASFSSSFFNFLDVASAKFMLPIGGFFISLFVGWYLNRRLVYAQLTNERTLKFGIGFLRTYIFLLRYVVPTAMLAIFIYGLAA
jgi:NSS family neurotransmitter:Na+ symporter